MTASSAITTSRANSQGGGLRTRNEQFVHLNLSIAVCAKRVFDKPFRALSQLLQLGERDAKYRLAGKRKFTAAELAVLLRSEEGIHFLVAIMGDAKPKWWTAVLRMAVLGGVARRREADLKLLRKVAHADEAAAATFPAALLVQDEDFYGPLLAGFDAAAAVGGSHRAMAAPKKR